MKKERFKSLSKKITYYEMGVFCKQFAAVLAAGIAIPQALKLLNLQKTSSVLQEVLSSVVQTLEEGQSLYFGFNRFETKLPRFFCQIVRAGELTNSLDLVFERLARYYTQRDQFQKQISQLLAYPCILFLSTLAVISFLFLKIIPGFQGIYESFQAELPLLTTCLMASSNHLQTHLKNYFIGFSFCVIFLSILTKIPQIKQRFIQLQYRLPFFGRLKQMLLIASLAKTWSLLLENGLEVLPAIELAVESSDFLIKIYLNQITSNLKKGLSLTRSLQLTSFFPDIFIEIINIGEESGTLSNMFERAAEMFEEEWKNNIQKFLTIFEPGLLIMIALFVGVIIFAIVQPLFELIKFV